MKVSIEKQPKSQVKLTIEVSLEEMGYFTKKAVSNISKNLNIPGFRPGKAPKKLVEQQVGLEKIWEEAAKLALPKTYVEAILKEKLEAIGQPKVTFKKLAPNNPLIYEAFISVLPEIKLPDYRKIKIKPKKIEVTLNEVEKVLEELRKSRAKYITVKRPAQKNDAAEIDFKTFLNKIPIEKGESKNHPLIIGEGYFVPGFEEKLVGMKEGEKKEFTLRFPKNYHQKHLADKDVDFKVEMKLVQERQLPELDDQFAQSLGKFKNISDLKTKLKENLKQEKDLKERSRIEMEILDKIVQNVKIEIPKILIEKELDKMMRELKNQVKIQGGEFKNYLQSIKKTKEDLKKEFQGRAKKRVKIGLILREIAKVENIKASDEEITEEINKTLKNYKFNEDIKKQIQSEEYKEYISGLIRNKKVFKLLRKSAVAD